jgi:hypothetical protein
MRGLEWTYDIWCFEEGHWAQQRASLQIERAGSTKITETKVHINPMHNTELPAMPLNLKTAMQQILPSTNKDAILLPDRTSPLSPSIFHNLNSVPHHTHHSPRLDLLSTSTTQAPFYFR